MEYNSDRYTGPVAAAEAPVPRWSCALGIEDTADGPVSGRMCCLTFGHDRLNRLACRLVPWKDEGSPCAG